MANEPEHHVQVMETHTSRGNDTVSDAHQFLERLPNGWKLVSLEHQDGWWVAKVVGPRVRAL